MVSIVPARRVSPNRACWALSHVSLTPSPHLRSPSCLVPGSSFLLHAVGTSLFRWDGTVHCNHHQLCVPIVLLDLHPSSSCIVRATLTCRHLVPTTFPPQFGFSCSSLRRVCTHDDKTADDGDGDNDGCVDVVVVVDDLIDLILQTFRTSAMRVSHKPLTEAVPQASHSPVD